MTKIHPSAQVSPEAKLGPGTEIGAGCVIEPGVVLGERNKVWMNVYIGPGTKMGDDNEIHMGAVIGHVPQDLSFTNADSYTDIGSRNTIREFVTIHRGTKEGTSTVIGDDNFIMTASHIAHNCEVGSKTIFTNQTTLGGYVTVGDRAVLAGYVVIHQFVRIGQLSMISGLSAVNKDVPPFLVCGGRPGVVLSVNHIGLRRAGISREERGRIKESYRILYRKGFNVRQAIAEIDQLEPSPEVTSFLDFLRSSKRGICAAAGDQAYQDTLRARKDL